VLDVWYGFGLRKGGEAKERLETLTKHQKYLITYGTAEILEGLSFVALALVTKPQMSHLEAISVPLKSRNT
jgi:hypothetical protein